MGSVYGIFLALTMMIGPRVTPEGVAAEERHGTVVASLASQTGVGHLVYSSISGADQHTGIPHLESKTRIEGHIRALGLPATILRPVSFMDNFASFNRPVLDGGQLVVSLALRPRTLLPLVATRDIGVFAAIAFEDPGRYLGRHVPLAGDCLTGPQIADVFARSCGLPAQFRQLPIGPLRAFDPDVARMFEWMDKRQNGEPDLAALRVKRGMGDAARRAGFTNVTELEPWEQARAGETRITACPARHGIPEITFILEAGNAVVFFAGDTLRIPELDEVARRWPNLDLALLPVNGLRIRPAFNKQVVMSAEQAGELCGLLRPKIAVPTHYAFTAGPIRDRLLLKYDGTPQRFQQAAAQHAPGTQVKILAPGEPFTL
jgi:uncharacterized protein YbjT (DUF2867 family)